jgi:hypothetical protein
MICNQLLTLWNRLIYRFDRLKDIIILISIIKIILFNSFSDFIEKIKIALQEDINLKLEARMAVAASNSWRMRITKLEGLIEDFVAGKPV